MSDRVPPIRSELLAAKIEKLLNFELPELFDEFSEEPRFIRALWFLEFVSKPHNYAGGLTKFAEDFIAASIDRIGTPTMQTLSQAKTYEPEEAIAILGELCECDRETLLGGDSWIFENALQAASSKGDRIRVERAIEDLSFLCDRDDLGDKLQTWEGSRRELYRVLIAKMPPAKVRSMCVERVTGQLANYLKEVCELPHVSLRCRSRGHGAPKYFDQVGLALLAFIDHRATDLQSKLAKTEVTQLVFRWMTKARTMRRPVMISGNSRFGKTEAVKLLCDTEPGNFRMVNTPASNAIGDLFREVARSLGIDVAAQNSVRDLRERIEYVLRFANLVLCFDEFQFVLPGSYSRNTAPARLNWVRRAVLDQGLAAVFICTPQSYLPAKKRFVKATGFSIEQFDERILKTLELPNELSESDLLAVARIHFADLENDYLQLVVDAALATERNFVSDIEKIATLAKDNAREHGRPRPLLCDIEDAIADVLPTRPQPTAGPLSKPRTTPIEAPLPRRCNQPAGLVQAQGKAHSNLPVNRRDAVALAVKT